MHKQVNFYPAKASLTEAIETAKAKLPITDSNTLNAVLMTYHNTLLKVIKEGVGNEANETKTGK